MIINDAGGMAEFVPDDKVGFVVRKDPSDIDAAILRFYDEKKEKEFSYNASVEKQKYSWGRMLEAINEAAGYTDAA